MKKIIIILGTVLLGVFIVSNLIMSPTGLKGTAQSITDKSKSIVDNSLLTILPTK